MLNFCFKKKSRLLTNYDFKYVFKNPNVIKCSEIIILARMNSLSYSRLGISISKKQIKYSYQRNKIKRVIREIFRTIQYRLINSDFVVITKFNFLKMNFKLLVRKLENLWSYYYQ
ncbi:MAG: ribonuclease P protein component [Buchnera aphidicola (Chaetogeoica yunlongensis)]